MSCETETLNRPVALPADLLPGSYLTDGVRLFRVVSSAGDLHPAQIVALEDCHTLDLLLHSIDDIRHAKLQLVRPPAVSAAA